MYHEVARFRPAIARFQSSTARFLSIGARIIQEEARKISLTIFHTSTGGGSDASFPASLGVPTVDGLGPVGGNQHSEDEYLEIASLIVRGKFFIRI